MYLRRRRGKIKLLWYPKNIYNLWYFVKITQIWCPKNLQKTCIWDVTNAKAHYYDAQKIQISYDVSSKLHYHDGRKYCENIEKNMYFIRILYTGFHGTLKKSMLGIWEPIFDLWDSFLALTSKCKLLRFYFMPIRVNYGSLGVYFFDYCELAGASGNRYRTSMNQLWTSGGRFSLGVDFRFWESS